MPYPTRSSSDNPNCPYNETSPDNTQYPTYRFEPNYTLSVDSNYQFNPCLSNAENVRHGSNNMLSPWKADLHSPNEIIMSQDGSLHYEQQRSALTYGSSTPLHHNLYQTPISPSLRSSPSSTDSDCDSLLSNSIESHQPHRSSHSKPTPSSKQQAYRNRKADSVSKMRHELVAMNIMPLSRQTHEPEVMSRAVDQLREYRNLLTHIQSSVPDMPNDLSAVPGAVKKRLAQQKNELPSNFTR